MISLAPSATCNTSCFLLSSFGCVLVTLTVQGIKGGHTHAESLTKRNSVARSASITEQHCEMMLPEASKGSNAFAITREASTIRSKVRNRVITSASAPAVIPLLRCSDFSFLGLPQPTTGGNTNNTGTSLMKRREAPCRVALLVSCLGTTGTRSRRSQYQHQFRGSAATLPLDNHQNQQKKEVYFHADGGKFKGKANRRLKPTRDGQQRSITRGSRHSHLF